MKPTKKAAAVTATKKNKRYSKAYPKAAPLARLKEQIGQLLLLLLAGNEQPDDWRQFERLLHRFYEGGVA